MNSVDKRLLRDTVNSNGSDAPYQQIPTPKLFLPVLPNYFPPYDILPSYVASHLLLAMEETSQLHK